MSKISSTISLAIPIVIGQLGVMLMGLADTVQVGRMQNLAAESLGASGMAGSIFFTIAVVGLICMQIVSPMISKAQAEDDFSECGNLLRASLRVAVFLAIITILIIGLVTLNYDLFGQSTSPSHYPIWELLHCPSFPCLSLRPSKASPTD
jgi:MATE family multidrug resistance protein